MPADRQVRIRHALQMDSVNCGTDKGHQKCNTLFCQIVVQNRPCLTTDSAGRIDKHPCCCQSGGMPQFAHREGFDEASRVDRSDNNKERE